MAGTFSLSVQQHIREIALLRAVAATPRQIRAAHRVRSDPGHRHRRGARSGRGDLAGRCAAGVARRPGLGAGRPFPWASGRGAWCRRWRSAG
ncbi:ABC transporter permease [Streptomyces macrolidinus]|uniref:ABC transporter permease n=1 Tax=Streptomyces macrolidinus TaxID=2952607 RepID=UPI0027E33F9C|nr:ABC transporter permease [Streptomyces macrolidinus]